MYTIDVILTMSNDTLEKQYRELFLITSPDKQNERIEFMNIHNLNELVKLKFNGNFGIHIASYDGHCEIVKRFLDLGVNSDVSDGVGDTSLHYASKYGHKDIVKLLLKGGANPNVSNRFGDTPLCYASNNGQKDIIKTLINVIMYN